jgi:hypothetical protein
MDAELSETWELNAPLPFAYDRQDSDRLSRPPCQLQCVMGVKIGFRSLDDVLPLSTAKTLP